jgi:hypothetical protein
MSCTVHSVTCPVTHIPSPLLNNHASPQPLPLPLPQHTNTKTHQPTPIATHNPCKTSAEQTTPIPLLHRPLSHMIPWTLTPCSKHYTYAQRGAVTDTTPTPRPTTTHSVTHAHTAPSEKIFTFSVRFKIYSWLCMAPFFLFFPQLTVHL